MWKPILLWLCLSGFCLAGPVGPKRNMPIILRQEEDMEKESAAVDDTSKLPEAADSGAATGDVPPNIPMISTLTLPSNATSIRADITDGFSCANKSYGYYADVENECQIFHVCMPVTYADGRENTFRWSFICPEETIFSQDSFTCMRREDMTIDCEESFKYYELNRNFGIIEENENKHSSSTGSGSGSGSGSSSNGDVNANSHQGHEDQEPAMTQIDLEQHPQQHHSQQATMDEKVEKPSSPTMIKPMQSTMTTTPKEKPMKVQKPNRRKPSHPSAMVSNSNKKKITPAPFRKAPQAVTTVQPAVLATTVEALQAEEETKQPPRFTKRPSTMSVNLKEKIQPIKQSHEPTPVRVDLYNQKRKRPSVFNKKDATTIKPVEEMIPATTELGANAAIPAAIPAATQSIVKSDVPDNGAEAATTSDLTNPSEQIVSQASETSSVVIKPESTALPNSDASLKKPESEKPTETEISLQTGPEILETEGEKAPVIIPIEAIEEIPAVIAEVEESNSKPEPIESTKKVEKAENEKEKQTEEQEEVDHDKTSSKTRLDEPVIFQQNSEETLTPESLPAIEEMEDQKPVNAPEIMPATADMEHQDPMIEHMFSETDTEANKQTMGGFKPVDPAMAAEAEALIANFLNTLMKSDKTNAEPVSMSMPMPVPVAVADKEMITESSAKEHMTEKDMTQQEIHTDEHEMKEPTMEAETQDTDVLLKTHTDTHAPPQITPPMGNMQQFPSMMMMMNNHPGEIFQIPVQVIQSSIEEDSTKTQSSQNIPPVSTAEISNPTHAPRPISIDDIVELVKDKLDQAPADEKEKETQNKEKTNTEKANKNVEPVPSALPQTEGLILPIYHRVSAEPNINMLTAIGKDDGTDLKKDTENSANIPETEMDPVTATETEIKSVIRTQTDSPTNTETALHDTDRVQGARSIKTATKMDPRKRRFLFKSDAS